MNKQALAREILQNLDQGFMLSELEIKGIELAQLVLEEEFKGFQSHMDSITRALSIEEQIAKAKQEQKEKDAEIVRKKGKMYMAEDAFNAIADQIMSS